MIGPGQLFVSRTVRSKWSWLVSDYQDNCCASKRRAMRILVAVFTLLACNVVSGQDLGANSREDEDGISEARLLIVKRCYSCHGENVSEANLNLANYESATSELPSGARAIVPGASNESELIRRIVGEGSSRMPPSESGAPSLTEEEIRLLKAWIESGARWESHWADQPIEKPEVPLDESDEWSRNEIDHFVHAQHIKLRLEPKDEARREVLIRRLYLDLIGIPPTMAEVDNFLADSRLDAYERLVDKILESSAFGEHWAAWWLDSARYADSNGFEKDRVRSMWPYRDWVINAFNQNMPFDQFTIEQLAGDLLEDPTEDQIVATGFHRNTIIHDEAGVHEDQFRDVVIKDRLETTASVWLGATLECAQCHDHKHDPYTQEDYYSFYAFFANTTDLCTSGENRRFFDQKKFDSLEVDSVLQVHDADEIRQELTVLRRKQLEQASGSTMEARSSGMTWLNLGRFIVIGGTVVIGTLAVIRRGEKQSLIWVTLIKLFCAILFVGVVLSLFFGGPYRSELASDAPASATILQEIEVLEKELVYAQRFRGQTLVMREGDSVATYVQNRGDFQDLVNQVQPGVPSVFKLPFQGPENRLGLAQWLVHPENPRTSRVLVNRVWARLFGHGLVDTADDFGVSGDNPTHPELLDFVSAEFIRNGWNFKQLLRSMVLSATYRQSSLASSEDFKRDPENHWLARGSRFRVDAEVLRDQALQLGGLLNRNVGGPSVFPPQPESVWNRVYTDGGQYQLEWTENQGEERYRRSLYIFLRRSAPHPLLATFDAGQRYQCVAVRERTNTPSQALALWNESTFLEAAGALAVTAMNRGGNAEDKVQWTFRRCTIRKPSESEKQVLVSLLLSTREHFEQDLKSAEELIQACRLKDVDISSELAAWIVVTNTLLNMDSVVTRE